MQKDAFLSIIAGLDTEPYYCAVLDLT